MNEPNTWEKVNEHTKNVNEAANRIRNSKPIRKYVKPYTEADRREHKKQMRASEYGIYILEKFRVDWLEALKNSRFTMYQY